MADRLMHNAEAPMGLRDHLGDESEYSHMVWLTGGSTNLTGDALADLAAIKTAIELIDHLTAANAGNVDANTQRVVVATDDVNLAAIKTAIELIDHLTAANAGNVDANTQRVVVATDDVNLAAIKTAVEILDNIVSGSEAQVDIITQPAAEQTTPTFYNLTLTVADTEYIQALPANTRALEFQCRTENDIRYSFETGKVATPTSPYSTLKAGDVWYKENILTSGSLYAGSSTAGVIIEIETWS